MPGGNLYRLDKKVIIFMMKQPPSNCMTDNNQWILTGSTKIKGTGPLKIRYILIIILDRLIS